MSIARDIESDLARGLFRWPLNSDRSPQTIDLGDEQLHVPNNCELAGAGPRAYLRGTQQYPLIIGGSQYHYHVYVHDFLVQGGVWVKGAGVDYRVERVWSYGSKAHAFFLTGNLQRLVLRDCVGQNAADAALAIVNDGEGAVISNRIEGFHGQWCGKGLVIETSVYQADITNTAFQGCTFQHNGLAEQVRVSGYVNGLIFDHMYTENRAEGVQSPGVLLDTRTVPSPTGPRVRRPSGIQFNNGCVIAGTEVPIRSLGARRIWIDWLVARGRIEYQPGTEQEPTGDFRNCRAVVTPIG